MCKILSSKDYAMKDQTHVWFYEINERGKKVYCMAVLNATVLILNVYCMNEKC